MDFKEKNVLITGATGFVGSYLSNYLLEEGANVYGLYRRRADGVAPKNLVERGVLDDIKLLEADLTDISALGNALNDSQPDYIFHLGAQSYIPASFSNPIETVNTNCGGTLNLLESIRVGGFDPRVVFAGSSEEYGLVISSQKQYERVLKKRENIFPKPNKIPEVPISETNPLRPMSPYGVTKVFGDHMFRNYFHSYGLKTIVSRGFNHEGAGRGEMFVTSVITRRIMSLKYEENDRIEIGNVNAFRDWSHVKDIVKGYALLSQKGRIGDVYNQGSQRVNSVLSYILLGLKEAGYEVKSLETIKNGKEVKDPLEEDNSEQFGVKFLKTKVDKMMLNDELIFDISDEGIKVETDKGTVLIEFKKDRFRPAEVPILLSNTEKISKIGFKVRYKVSDIIKDQLNYYMDPKRRRE